MEKDQPDIMAIGNSMYQGIRSLSYLPSMTRHSVPAQVAAALNISFTLPDLPVPLLFDLEDELRRGGLLQLVKQIRKACLANLASWPLDQPWSRHAAFDNIAVGGARIGSLWTDTYDAAIGDVSRLGAKLADDNLSLAALGTTIGDLWYALNTCYTLNPRHLPAQGGLTQLDQVERRQPRILLINIGSNEGLFRAGFTGDVGPAAKAGVAGIPALVQALAERLQRLPSGVERIVFNTLIRPRFIPNLMPAPEHENECPGEQYYPAYGPRIGLPTTPITPAQMAEFDTLVAEVNAKSMALLQDALGPRVVFADIYAKCAPFDGKHYFDRGLTIPGTGRLLSNKPVTPIPFSYYGGFTGLDNMHPTVPGYATIADAVLEALGHAGPGTNKDAAYAADTLLNNLRGLPILVAEMEMSLIGITGVFRGNDAVAAAQSCAAAS